MEANKESKSQIQAKNQLQSSKENELDSRKLIQFKKNEIDLLKEGNEKLEKQTPALKRFDSNDSIKEGDEIDLIKMGIDFWKIQNI